MSLAADAFQPQLVRGLISMRGRAPLRFLADTLTSAPGAGYDLDFDAAAKRINVDFREPVYIGEAFGSDASRFAAACFTSMDKISDALLKAETLPWGIVRLYYSAYYAGHALLRLLGHSCTTLGTQHINKIRDLSVALGNPVPFDISAGLYHCELNASQTGMAITAAGTRMGGSHEVFWDLFDAFLSRSVESFLGHLAARDAHEVFAQVEALRRIIRRGNGASWLSAVRNDVQYRQAFELWPPKSMKRAKREALSRLAEQWTRDPMNIDVENAAPGHLSAFVLACSFTAALCRAMVSRLSARSTAGAQSFARPLTMLY